MSQVKVTGLVSTTRLARGESVTVERTETIDALADAGYVSITELDVPDHDEPVIEVAADVVSEAKVSARKPRSRRG